MAIEFLNGISWVLSKHSLIPAILLRMTLDFGLGTGSFLHPRVRAYMNNTLATRIGNGLPTLSPILPALVFLLGRGQRFFLEKSSEPAFKSSIATAWSAWKLTAEFLKNIRPFIPENDAVEPNEMRFFFIVYFLRQAVAGRSFVLGDPTFDGIGRTGLSIWKWILLLILQIQTLGMGAVFLDGWCRQLDCPKHGTSRALGRLVWARSWILVRG